MMYAASLPKIAILLAYFAFRPEADKSLDEATRRELGLMIKVSDNEIAAKYSEQLGLKRIQHLLISLGLYEPLHGGGIWIGKHYGRNTERYADPIGSLSHGATIRQLLRFYLWMEQGKLVSPQTSTAMREIFASPTIPHTEDKFVAGLAGRSLAILRKAGWWEDWFHDTAIIAGPNRHYILAAMTHHSKGEQYLREVAAAVDDMMRI
jgi:beta-lactamase class A